MAGTQWPLFEGASQKLLSLINLYARTAVKRSSGCSGDYIPGVESRWVAAFLQGLRCSFMSDRTNVAFRRCAPSSHVPVLSPVDEV